jgi:hypothetical protein
MRKINAGNTYKNAINDILNIKNSVDTSTTANEKPSKFSGGGLMGNGKGSEDPNNSGKQPYYEPHLQALLRAAAMRKKVRND